MKKPKVCYHITVGGHPICDIPMGVMDHYGLHERLCSHRSERKAREARARIRNRLDSNGFEDVTANMVPSECPVYLQTKSEAKSATKSTAKSATEPVTKSTTRFAAKSTTKSATKSAKH
jgi:hypothetical protein